MPYGYYISSGYMGLVDGSYILFATEEEYFEYVTERNENEQK